MSKTFMQKAIDFLGNVSGRAARLSDKETELNAKLTQLTADKLTAESAYDPDKPFDAGKITVISAEISAIETELAALKRTRKVTPDQDAAESVALIANLKAEATGVLKAKAQEANRVRESIAEYKQKYLKALANHNAIYTESLGITDDYNETLRELSLSVKTEAARLRDEYRVIDRQIYESVTGQDTTGLSEKKSAIMRQVSVLEAQISAITSNVQSIDSYALSGLDNPYKITEFAVSQAANGRG